MSETRAAPPAPRPGAPNEGLLRWLTGVMFLMFAMTSDAVGAVIPRIIAEFHISLTDASQFQSAFMLALGGAALLFGFLADSLGRRGSITIGLLLYGAASLLFAFGHDFAFFVGLMALSGIGVAVFKIGALALVGDISHSSEQHTTTMNLIEGFFGVGSIVGPFLVGVLLDNGFSWKWLYVVASGICAVLVFASLLVRYPRMQQPAGGATGFVGAVRMLGGTARMLGNPYALGFSLLIALYVATECAIYVWMPTYLQGYQGVAWLPVYALTIFFVLRAGGRFLGIWLLGRMQWASVLVVLAGAILACFAGALAGGKAVGAWTLPLSGLFMSMVYPTINSKGISCFPRNEHGTVAGVILFFTAVAAAAGPWLMARVSDSSGDIASGFKLATVFAALLFAGLLYNWLRQPAAARLAMAGDSAPAAGH